MRTGRPGFDYSKGRRFLSVWKHSNHLWGPPSFLSKTYQSFQIVKRPAREGNHSVVKVKKSGKYLQRSRANRLIHIAIIIWDSVHGPGIYSKHVLTETGICLRFQVERTHLKTETESSLRNADFKYTTGRWLMSKIVTIILIYHRHKPIDTINLLVS
jgi:hypothetical protein